MPDNLVMLEIQRAVGRLESSQEALAKDVINGLRDIKNEFVAHKNEDNASFIAIRSAIAQNHAVREKHLRDQDDKLGILQVASASQKTQDENTRTIGKWIIGAFGTLALVIGSAVIAALSGHIKII